MAEVELLLLCTISHRALAKTVTPACLPHNIYSHFNKATAQSHEGAEHNAANYLMLHLRTGQLSRLLLFPHTAPCWSTHFHAECHSKLLEDYFSLGGRLRGGAQGSGRVLTGLSVWLMNRSLTRLPYLNFSDILPALTPELANSRLSCLCLSKVWFW